jgi:DNA-binding response OmpR family regulator
MPRILLIDDDQTMLDLEKVILSDLGYDVLVTKDPLAALDILELYRMDLVIVDVEMPRINGFQFVTTIRNNPALQHLSIAFLSAHSESETIEKAAKLGADFYILKPIEHHNFIDKVKSFLESKALVQHPVIEYQPPFLIELKSHFYVHITEFSDIGVKILTNQDLEDGQILELPAEEFGGVFSENPLLKVSWSKPYKDISQASLIFVNQPLELVRKVQRYIQTRIQPELLKYPKWR